MFLKRNKDPHVPLDNPFLTRQHLLQIADYAIDNDFDELMMKVKTATLPDYTVIACQASSIYLLIQLLPNLKNKIVLCFITYSNPIPYSYMNFFNILNHPNIVRIFSENWYDHPHPKLSQIPIGVAFNQVCKNNLEHTLQNISDSMIDNKDKPLRVLCNAHKVIHKTPHSLYRDDRSIMIEKLKNNDAIDFCRDRHDLSKKSLTRAWNKHSNYAFELSPSGTGLDCHRTYEAIILKTIPIVRSNTLDSMYRQHDLPVVIVDEWDQVTRDNLQKWHLKYQSYFTTECIDKIKLNYWKDIIRGGVTINTTNTTS